MKGKLGRQAGKPKTRNSLCLQRQRPERKRVPRHHNGHVHEMRGATKEAD
jgi:hypothetical protein